MAYTSSRTGTTSNYFDPFKDPITEKSTPNQRRAKRKKAMSASTDTIVVQVNAAAGVGSVAAGSHESNPKAEVSSFSVEPQTAGTGSVGSVAEAAALAPNLTKVLMEKEYSELSSDQQTLFATFAASLVEEYPDLAKALAHLNDPKDLEKLDDTQKNCFVSFLIKNKTTLKILLGYLTTAWPLFIQYLYPPFVSIHDRNLADVFSASGIFVNVALTGVVAGPVFADAIINALQYIKKSTYEGKPVEAFNEMVAYWWPKEWTAEQKAYLAERAAREGRGSAYIALQQLISLGLPLMRLGVAGWCLLTAVGF